MTSRISRCGAILKSARACANELVHAAPPGHRNENVDPPFQSKESEKWTRAARPAVAERSISLDAEMVFLSGCRLIAQIGFERIAMVDYNKTTDDRMILMEINRRP
jgi:hypothetical protein